MDTVTLVGVGAYSYVRPHGKALNKTSHDKKKSETTQVLADGQLLTLRN